MGLDISFLEEASETVGLEGERLASVPEFLNFVFVLGMVVDMLDDPNSGEEEAACLRRCTAYTDKRPQAEDRFCNYLSFLGRGEETLGAEIQGSLDPFQYHRLALRLAAAMMLRDEPILGDEAREILEFARPLCTLARRVAEMMKITEGDPSRAHPGDSMVAVFEKYIRCLEVAAAQDVPFKIEF
jgi:hypothetical protein